MQRPSTGCCTRQWANGMIRSCGIQNFRRAASSRAFQVFSLAGVKWSQILVLLASTHPLQPCRCLACTRRQARSPTCRAAPFVPATGSAPGHLHRRKIFCLEDSLNILLSTGCKKHTCQTVGRYPRRDYAHHQ